MGNKIDDLGYLLNKAARITKWDLNNRLGNIPLTAAQWAVLKDINIYGETGERNANLTPASIAERLNSDRPTISGIIDRLEKQEWVYRVMNPEDRRSYVIMLTTKAKEHMAQLEKFSNETIEQAVKGLNEEQIREFKKYLIHVISNFA